MTYLKFKVRTWPEEPKNHEDIIVLYKDNTIKTVNRYYSNFFEAGDYCGLVAGDFETGDRWYSLDDFEEVEE